MFVKFCFLLVQISEHLTQPNLIDNWQDRRENHKEQVEQKVGFEKPFSQNESTDAGQGDGDTDCDHEGRQDIILCPRDRQAIKMLCGTNLLKPPHGFPQNEIEDDIFQIVKIEKEGGDAGLYSSYGTHEES